MSHRMKRLHVVNFTAVGSLCIKIGEKCLCLLYAVCEKSPLEVQLSYFGPFRFGMHVRSWSLDTNWKSRWPVFCCLKFKYIVKLGVAEWHICCQIFPQGDAPPRYNNLQCLLVLQSVPCSFNKRVCTSKK